VKTTSPKLPISELTTNSKHFFFCDHLCHGDVISGALRLFFADRLALQQFTALANIRLYQRVYHVTRALKTMPPQKKKTIVRVCARVCVRERRASFLIVCGTSVSLQKKTARHHRLFRVSRQGFEWWHTKVPRRDMATASRIESRVLRDANVGESPVNDGEKRSVRRCGRNVGLRCGCDGINRIWTCMRFGLQW
jgi:hypothetical protein